MMGDVINVAGWTSGLAPQWKGVAKEANISLD